MPEDGAALGQWSRIEEAMLIRGASVFPGVSDDRYGSGPVTAAVVLLMRALLSGGAAARTSANPPDLFSSPASSSGASQQDRTASAALRSHRAVADLGLIDRLPANGSGTLRLNLFADAAFTARFSHLDTVSTPSRAWWGTLDGEPAGTFTLVRNDSGIAAVIRAPGKGVYEVRSAADGTSFVREIDTSRFKCFEADAGTRGSPLQAAKAPASAAPSVNTVGMAKQAPPAQAPTASPPVIYGCDDGTVIDIMIVYTAQARASAGGTAAMNNNIALAIADANAAFSRSLIDTSLHLVYTYEVNYVETGDFQTDTNRLVDPADGYLDDVPPLRDYYGADCLSFWSDTYNLYDYGYYPDASLQGIGASGLTLMDWRGYDGLLLAHEVGHNLWCAHDRANDTVGGYADYSHGYVEPGHAWMTIMAVAAVPRIAYYANPNVNWPGPDPPDPGPTGVPVGQPDPCDIALTITQTRHIVANFRATIVPGLPAVLYVKADASPDGDGQSWPTALQDLQDALCRAAGSRGAMQQIWVAAGTYRPDRGTGDRSASFNLQDNLAVYGGFAGTESSLNQRDWTANATILSGDIGTTGDNSDNSYHVVRGLNVGVTASLDGFRVTGGNANSADYPDYDGGGMRLEGAVPVIANCTFTGNNAANVAGGVESINAADATFTACTFSSNTSTNTGGGVHCYMSSPTFTDCTFDNNASASGGGLHNQNSSTPSLAGCTFNGNSAQWGGGLLNSSCSPPLTGCTFTGNTSVNGGGGLENDTGSNTVATACQFVSNTANFGAGVYNYQSDATFSQCTFTSNSSTAGSGMYNYAASPTTTDCTFFAEHRHRERRRWRHVE
jgi:hypothetical protein